MPLPELQPGLTLTKKVVVDEGLIAPCVSRHFVGGFTTLPPVFATAFMVGLVEWTCVECLHPHLLPGEHSVGTGIDITHTAATPIGMSVSAEVQLLAVVGRLLRFRVTCRDELDVVGEGSHERMLIRLESFTARAARKRRHVISDNPMKAAE